MHNKTTLHQLSGWGVVSLLYLLACALQYRYLKNNAAIMHSTLHGAGSVQDSTHPDSISEPNICTTVTTVHNGLHEHAALVHQ
jgi:hypothetical protein